MLFHVTQTHSPEACPLGKGGVQALYNADAEGVELRAIYGAYAEHVVYYVLDADSLNAVHKFLVPGFKSCNSTVTPVVEEPAAG